MQEAERASSIPTILIPNLRLQSAVWRVHQESVSAATNVHARIDHQPSKQSSSAVFFCLFHSPLDVVLHFLVFLRSFRLKSLLSQFSLFVAQIENFCGDQIHLTMFAKDLTGCLSHCCVEGGGHWLYVCIFVAHDGERCKPPPIIAWKLSNTLGSFSFSRSNLSFVCFGLLIFFRWRRKVIISKSWSLPMLMLLLACLQWRAEWCLDSLNSLIFLPCFCTERQWLH